MPVFRSTIRQAYNGPEAAYKWSNVYYVDAPDLTEAANRAGALATAQTAVLDAQGGFVYETYTSDLVPGTDQFVIRQLSGGIRGALLQGGELMPAFVTVRLDFGILGVGRESRKFIRAPWREGSIASGDSVTSVGVQGLNDLIDFITSAQWVVDESGNVLATGAIAAVTSKRLGKLSGLLVPPLPPS